MPTYEYECKSCHHRFDAFQSMSDDPLKKCPECGGAVQRLIGGGVGIIFKGSGFYATDSRKGSEQSESKKESSDPPKSSEKKKEEKSSDTKKTSTDKAKSAAS